MVAVHHWICLIFELLRHENLGIFLGHLSCHFHALFDAVADVSRIVNQNNSRSVVFHQESAFTADRIGHDDDGLVAFYCTDQSQTYTLVSAGWLDDDGIRFEDAILLGFLYHVEGRPRLDRTAYIESFVFYQHPGTLRVCHAAELDHRGMPHSFKYIVIYHFISPVKQPLLRPTFLISV